MGRGTLTEAIVVFAILILMLVGTQLTVPLANAASGDTWATMAAMPTARWGLETAVVNGKIYALGGQNSSGWLGTNEMYDPQTNSWATLAPMSTPRSNFGIAVYGTKIFCIGGEIGNGTAFGQLLATSVNEVYDSSTNTWKTLAAMPTQKQSFQAVTFNGKIYCIGGYQQYNAFLHWGFEGENAVYNIETNSWTNAANAPTPIWGYACAALNEKVYLISGGNQNSSGSFPKSLTQIYDLNSSQWSQAIPPIEPLFYSAGGTTNDSNSDAKIYVFGGYKEYGQVTNLSQAYDPLTNSWRTTTSMHIARGELAVTIVNDELYALGGNVGAQSRGIASSVNEKYTPLRPEATPTPTLSPSPTPTQQATPEPSPTPDNSQDSTPTIIIGGTAAVAVAIAVLALIFLRRRKP